MILLYFNVKLISYFLKLFTYKFKLKLFTQLNNYSFIIIIVLLLYNCIIIIYNDKILKHFVMPTTICFLQIYFF